MRISNDTLGFTMYNNAKPTDFSTNLTVLYFVYYLQGKEMSIQATSCSNVVVL